MQTTHTGNTLGVAEVLEQASNLPTLEERIEFLRKHSSFALKIVLKCAFEPGVEFDLDPGRPDYRPSPYVEGQGILYKSIPKFLDCLKGRAEHIDHKRKQKMFIGLLEMLDPKDAELLVAVKDKIMPYTNITPELVEEAFGKL